MGDFPGMAQLLRRMDHQLAAFDGTRDHRAAFLRVYRHMTRRALARMEGDFFLDPAWVERIALHFADYYFAALESFTARRHAPPAWQLAFECAQSQRCFLLQDIVLGVNAHINNDLPQVLADILRAEHDWKEPSRMVRRRFDHDQINRILHEIVPAVEGEVAQHYGRLISPLGRLLGTLDEALAAHGLKEFRDNTWRNARFLLAAQGSQEQEQVRRWIERDARFVGDRVVQFGSTRWSRPLAKWARRLRLC